MSRKTVPGCLSLVLTASLMVVSGCDEGQSSTPKKEAPAVAPAAGAPLKANPNKKDQPATRPGPKMNLIE
jgi:hypothetical protein